MSQAEPKQTARELPLIYMNGRVIPFGSHELVAALRSRTSVLLLIALAVVLSLPAGGTLSGAWPLEVRVPLNVLSILTFVGLFPALLFDAQHRAASSGKDKVHLLSVSLPSAILTILAVEAFAILLLDIGLSRRVLVAKLAFGVAFWELVVFLLAWFYVPAMVQDVAAKSAQAQTCASVTIGTTRINPRQLRRIETDGRYLRLFLDQGMTTVPARLRDLVPSLAPYGMLIHRCHWVAFEELGQPRPKGRSFEMTTLQGDVLPVARERRTALKAVLSERPRS